MERLDIQERPDGYCEIGWWDEANDIEGYLCLGEVVVYGDEDEDEARACEEHNWISSEVAKQFPADHLDGDRYLWDGVAKSKKVLALARALQKQFRSKPRPWPDWALRAAAENWKPPKGWKS
jgi:hypothetical protein